jgi:hypothetical protein
MFTPIAVAPINGFFRSCPMQLTLTRRSAGAHPRNVNFLNLIES